jgi:hypothetical protein
MSKKENRVGEKHITNEGYEIEIIEYFGAFNCTVQFNDRFNTILYNVIYHQVTKRNIENPNHPKTYNIGYMGIGKFFAKKNGVKTQHYIVWSGIIRRCYNENERHKYPSYKGCLVVEEWHNFQNFAQWFDENYNPETMQDWQLDKDILVKGNKIYSPETCCFVPQEINLLFVNSPNKLNDLPKGVIKHGNKYRARFGKNRKHIGLFNIPEEAFHAYKIAKEQHIKETADEWKGLISEEVYQAMYNYVVEITD